MEKIAVSACLCGIPCRMDGKAKPNDFVIGLYQRGIAVPVYPEQDGDLTTPRDPSEQRDGRVYSSKGMDVTDAFVKGASIDLQKAKDNGCHTAILKSKSPSCGVGLVHNGKFDGGLVEGDGVFTKMLKENGFECIVDTEAEEKFKGKV
ncbi:MAG: DUF523 domain-containing protein [Bulleidia sp.]|nr:DUF523 domain-containing protein [Bulleidia sp.]